MANSAMPWAYQAVVSYSRMNAAANRGGVLRAVKCGGLSLEQRSPAPNLLLSQSANDVRRAVWLLHRPSGVLGLVVSPRPGTHYGSMPHEAAPLGSPGVKRVMRHLRSLSFRVAGDGPTCPPMVVHKNQLIGWCLGGKAAPLYAHTIDELARLKPGRIKTLSPENAFVCVNYYEWDDWREVSMEPGWSWHHADEHVANGLVSGQLSPDDLHNLAVEVA
ncbi:hypothetical protein TcG_06273 [Trypanosoma cruzi]|uniref:Uncharacterized protein n=1 Tax=Trypanosoma cruzi TaxID=5693 RepID=A0A2V2V9G1_TRYCR|nr:hypothetical protein C4B63_39g352 [Trypanosoma cruzi]RNF16556.1 hypothetical protein TcG_06273 [Trypanosoma cruzi]